MYKQILRIFAFLTLMIFCSAEILAQTSEFVVGDKEIVVNTQTRQSLGLQAWTDLTLGVMKAGSQYTFFGANPAWPNLGVTKTVGTLANPVATSVQAHAVINGDPGYNYLSIGSVYKISGSTLIGFTHAETWLGTYKHFYSALGIAKSTDNGNSWTYLGEIVTTTTSYDQWILDCWTYGSEEWIAHDLGSGCFVIKNVGGIDYFYMYIQDDNGPGVISIVPQHLAIVRAKVSDVVNAALSNRVSVWNKYNNGTWIEPGLGGQSSNILPSTTQFWHLSVSYSSYFGKYFLIYNGGDFEQGWGFHICQSPDGETWSDQTMLLDANATGENAAYPSIVGLGENPQYETGSGPDFYIYYDVFSTGLDWSTGALARRLITGLSSPVSTLGAPTLISPIGDVPVHGFSTTLKWTVPIGGDAATWYAVYMVAPDGVTDYGYWVQGTQVSTGTLTQRGFHYWAVTAYNETSPGIWVEGEGSIEGRFDLLGTLTAPSNLTATQASGRVTLRWTDRSVNEVRFDIYRATGAASTSFAKVGEVGANITTFSQNVTRGKTYRYKVRAVNAAGGVSSFSNTRNIVVP